MSAAEQHDDDAAEKERLKRLFTIAGEAIDAGLDVLPAAVWLKDDGTLDKAPLTLDGHLNAHHDRQRIYQELADIPHKPKEVPEAYEVVVGIVPGSAGLVTLDADVKRGKRGKPALDALRVEHGDFVTSAWRSPSGGVNVLLRKPAGARYGNHSPWPGIDVRADGGWMVAPGNTCVGGEWVWLPGRGGYASASPLPPAMAELLRAPSSGRKATNAETVAFIEASPVGSTLPVMHRFRDELIEFRRSGQGSRHDALLHIVGWAFGMKALDLRDALVRIKADWRVLTAGEGREDEVTEIACWVAGKEIDKRAREAEQPPPGVDPATGEVLPASGDDDGMVALIDWSEVHDPADDVVEGLIMFARWTQFVASAKTGKSTLLMWMSLELSQGRDPLDGTPIEPVTVLYADGEMGRDDLEELIRSCGHDPASLTNWYATNERMRLDTAAGASRLLARVDQLGARVVFLDGLNGFVNPEGSENDDHTWRPLVTHTSDPLKQRRIALVSADNMGKDRKRGTRGSSVKNDKADGVIQLDRTHNGIRLHASHGRGGAYIAAPLILDVVGLDRSVPIRYRRGASSDPPGTPEAVALLKELGVPIEEGRWKVRARLRAEMDRAEAAGLDAERYRVGNDVLTAALRSRRQLPVAPK